MTSEVKNRKSNHATGGKSLPQAQFINHNFTPDDKAKFKEWAASSMAQLGDIIDRLTDDGYRITLKPDDYTGAYACFLQAISPDSDNAGFILTGRSHSSSMALLAAVYRHYVLFEGDWPTDTVYKSRMDDE